MFYPLSFFMAKGGATTATTCIRPYKQAAGLSTIQTMEERFAYGLNPKKLGAVSSHLCDPATAAARFVETAFRAGGAVICWGAVLCRSPVFFVLRDILSQRWGTGKM